MLRDCLQEKWCTGDDPTCNQAFLQAFFAVIMEAEDHAHHRPEPPVTSVVPDLYSTEFVQKHQPALMQRFPVFLDHATCTQVTAELSQETNERQATLDLSQEAKERRHDFA